MNYRILRIVIGSIAIIAAVIFCYFYFSDSAANEVQVETLVVEKGSVAKVVTATGTVQPITQVEVGTQVSGVVEKIYVDFNSQVKAGQLLAELDKVNLEAALLQSQASYDNIVNERNYLQGIHDRQKTLYDRQLLSQSDYDQALYNLNNAKSSVIQRESDLQRAKTNLGYAKIYSPISGVVLSKNVDEGQTVAASYSTPTLFTIAQDLKQMQVEADVDEADIGQVIEGQRVSFTVDAYQGEEFTGKVTQVRLNPTTTSNVVTYTVVIRAENPELKLKPGLTAVVSIYTLELNDILTIQSKVVNFQPDIDLIVQYRNQHGIVSEMPDKIPPLGKDGKKPEGMPEGFFPMGKTSKRPDGKMPEGFPPLPNGSKMVWKLENGDIRPSPVTLGASDGINVEILSGLLEGDTVIFSMKSISNEASGPAGPDAASSPFVPKMPGGKRK
ncbi:MAG: efflux RND transporter periplasmic adaptor subunit [Flavobacteriales bacterium]|nr:efflux RND transporter periplasmic adaptor subunit [Flavobacteriales bacterium]